MSGRTVVHGVCGGISAYKAVEVVRRLVEARCEVHVVMTAEATRFVGPLTFREISYHAVETDLFSTEGRLMRHLSLAESAHLLLVAPATANIIAKLAHGQADDLLTTLALSVTGPRLIAPAMDAEMYKNRVTQENLSRLRSLGYAVVDPEEGRLARGNIGPGRLAAPERIVAEALRLLQLRQDLRGRRLLVTAGATQEPMDPVRFLTNGASGRMGVAVAEAAAERGAEVTLVAAPLSVEAPAGVTVVPVRTAEEMYAAVLSRFAGVDAVIKAAAVADYRFAESFPRKLKKSAPSLSVQLVRTPDILAELGRQKSHQVLVGFAAETEDLIEHARAKLSAKRLDMIVANDLTQPGAGFGTETNQVTILHRDGRVEPLSLMPKRAVADAILDRVQQVWEAGSAPTRTADRPG